MAGETKHSPEPWRTVDRVFEEDRIFVLTGPGHRLIVEDIVASLYTDEHEGRQADNARRVVACVNALAGIPTEALEAGALAKLLDHVEARAAEEGCPHGCGCGVLPLLRALGRLP